MGFFGFCFFFRENFLLDMKQENWPGNNDISLKT